MAETVTTTATAAANPAAAKQKPRILATQSIMNRSPQRSISPFGLRSLPVMRLALMRSPRIIQC